MVSGGRIKKKKQNAHAGTRLSRHRAPHGLATTHVPSEERLPVFRCKSRGWQTGTCGQAFKGVACQGVWRRWRWLVGRLEAWARSEERWQGRLHRSPWRGRGRTVSVQALPRPTRPPCLECRVRGTHRFFGSVDNSSPSQQARQSSSSADRSKLLSWEQELHSSPSVKPCFCKVGSRRARSAKALLTARPRPGTWLCKGDDSARV